MFSTVLIFIVMLAALVFVHELGHFTLAKLFGIRVDEFAIGFPPRLFSRRYKGTDYSINALPLGGYVKIFGEDGSSLASDDPDRARSFAAKNRAIQAAVLLGGIAMNIIFAWILLSATYMTGAPVSTSDYSGSSLANVELVVLDVMAGSPAAKAGITSGDAIVSVSDAKETIDHPSPDEMQRFTAAHGASAMNVSLIRGSRTLDVTLTPEKGIIGSTPGIGISMDEVGTLHLSLFAALVEGARRTYYLFTTIAQAIGAFLYQAVTFHADISEVSGPVGIAVMVGTARTLGFFYLMSFTALISLNLAVINFIPFPALDGGRLLFVAIEAIIRRPLPERWTQTVNAVGFALLLLLLVLVTFKDIANIVHPSSI